MARVFVGKWINRDGGYYMIEYTFTLHDNGTWDLQMVHEDDAHGAYMPGDSGEWRKEGGAYVLGSYVLHEQPDGSLIYKDVRLVESKG
jgi:hypothetical protein